MSHKNFVPLFWINSAGRISIRICDFRGDHSASRIRYFGAKFEQNNVKSVGLMIFITLVRLKYAFVSCSFLKDPDKKKLVHKACEAGKSLRVPSRIRAE